MKIDILWFLTLQVCFCCAVEKDCRREPKCGIARVHKMKAANCFDKKFQSFPKCLISDVEVIDLSFNRIRKVTKTDIDKFKYLKFLYLADNLISNLNEDTFDDVDLSTLDLSINAITKISPTIFHLPSLKTLYLSQNLNINLVDALESAKPISSPLTQIDISKITDEENYSDFPNFGVLPYLVQLNISGNFYYTITPTFFMGLCNLQNLINDNVTTDFKDPCDCWRINVWLKNKLVKFTPFTCTVLQKRCLYEDIKEEDLQIYNQCKEKVETIRKKNLINQVSIGLGASIAIILLVIFLIYLWRRRKNRQATLKEAQKICLDNSSTLHMQEKSVPNEYSIMV